MSDDKETKKTLGFKRKYELTDTVKKESTFADLVKVRLINNERGDYIDVRKYFGGRPSTKGIRLRSSDFIEISKLVLEWLELERVENSSVLSKKNN